MVLLVPGLIWIPDYPFCEQKARFSFASFLTRPEVILLLTQVKNECNKTAAMSLFNLTLAKCVCLEEFEQIQVQTFSQVSKGGVEGEHVEQPAGLSAYIRHSSCRSITWTQMSLQRRHCGWGREESACVCQIYWDLRRMGWKSHSPLVNISQCWLCF